MTWYIGGESDWYEPRESATCPCSDGGLLLCYCGSEVTFSDGRDWLDQHGIPAEALYADEVVGLIEEHHPGGYEEFHEETAGRKAAEGLRRLGALDAMRRAA